MEEIEPYIVYINGALNLAVIGFIVRFSLMMRSAFREKEEILKERLDAFDEELKRTEKWAGRNEEQLKKERDELQRRLDQTLGEANVDIHSFDLVQAVEQISNEFKGTLKDISSKIENLEVSNLESDYELNLSMAKAFASNNEWLKAANQYDIVTRSISNNWELYFFKGVAYANSRNGIDTDLKALQGYSDSIVYIPENLNSNLKARLFIYQGAMLKRLNRLNEAENSILVGLGYAEAKYERGDGLYNLACVYAMKNNQDKYSEISNELKSLDQKKYSYLILRLEEYAPNFEIQKSV